MADMRKYIIITADIDVKILNKLIISLRDWENGEDDTWDDCTILATKKDLTDRRMDIDRPPVQNVPENEFLGQSIEELEKLLLTQPKGSLFLILDQEGVEQETIIIAEQAIDNSEEFNTVVYLDRYNKVRVPWTEAHMMWCNLDIANMSFEEYCVDEDADEGGWLEYNSTAFSDLPDDCLRRRDGMLREWAKLDLA